MNFINFINLLLILSSFGAPIHPDSLSYIETPLYILNEDYAIYQTPYSSKTFYPDIETFTVVNKDLHCGLAYDKRGVYYNGIFMDIDTSELQIVGSNNLNPYSWLWKNKNKVYSDTNIISGAHAASFSAIECINGGYFIDKNNIYYYDKKINGSDSKSVNKTCDNSICYDKKNVYYKGEILFYKGKKVKPVNELFFKTNNDVLIQQEFLEENFEVYDIADAKTIKSLSRSFSYDKNNLYYRKNAVKRLIGDPKFVKVWDQINSAFYSDGVNIYQGYGTLHPYLDAESFGMLENSDFYYDKNGIYNLYVGKYISRGDLFENSPIALNYNGDFFIDSLFISNFYFLYNKTAYDKSKKIVIDSLSDSDIEYIKEGYYLPSIYEPTAYEIDTNIYYHNSSFNIKNDSLYLKNASLISTQKLELLAIYKGERMRFCRSSSIGARYSNIYYFRNKYGFWLVDTYGKVVKIENCRK